jgi:hypothetical protein
MSFITEAKDCESAYNVITNPESDVFDIAFLDISMPPTKIRAFIQAKIQIAFEYMPNCKIIYLQCSLSFKNNHKKYKLNGLVIKNDLTFDELLFAFDKVIKKTNVLQSISY